VAGFTLQAKLRIGQNKRGIMIELVRNARKSVDGSNGVLVLHSWGTGFQYLVFPTWSDATLWYSKLV